MFNDPVDLGSIVQQFGLAVDPRSFHHWKGSGFSGSQIWRFTSMDQSDQPTDYCLRGHHLSAVQIERILWQANTLSVAAELPFLLQPKLAKSAQPFLQARGQIWLIELWANGQNDFHKNANQRRISCVMNSLAQLHQIWFDRAQSPAHDIVRQGPSSGLQQRLRLAEDWLANDTQFWNEIRSKAQSSNQPAWHLLVEQLYQGSRSQLPSIRDRLQLAQNWQLPLGTVLGDPWSDHLFFTPDDQLSAIIDYQTIRWDSVAADLSRVICSLLGQDQTETPAVNPLSTSESILVGNGALHRTVAHKRALDDYQSVRRLSSIECEALELYNDSSRALGPLLWLRWIFLEQKFSPTNIILDRVSKISRGLPF